MTQEGPLPQTGAPSPPEDVDFPKPDSSSGALPCPAAQPRRREQRLHVPKLTLKQTCPRLFKSEKILYFRNHAQIQHRLGILKLGEDGKGYTFDQRTKKTGEEIIGVMQEAATCFKFCNFPFRKMPSRCLVIILFKKAKKVKKRFNILHKQERSP